MPPLRWIRRLLELLPPLHRGPLQLVVLSEDMLERPFAVQDLPDAVRLRGVHLVALVLLLLPSPLLCLELRPRLLHGWPVACLLRVRRLAAFLPQLLGTFSHSDPYLSSTKIELKTVLMVTISRFRIWKIGASKLGMNISFLN